MFQIVRYSLVSGFFSTNSCGQNQLIFEIQFQLIFFIGRIFSLKYQGKSFLHKLFFFVEKLVTEKSVRCIFSYTQNWILDSYLRVEMGRHQNFKRSRYLNFCVN